jgi:hypothetical protein
MRLLKRLKEAWIAFKDPDRRHRDFMTIRDWRLSAKVWRDGYQNLTKIINRLNGHEEETDEDEQLGEEQQLRDSQPKDA